MAVESFDASDFGSVDDLKGSQFLEAKGQYHLAIVDIDESRKDGNGIKFKFVALAGTVPGQENKTFRDMFWDPSGASKDGGKFAKARRLSLLLATGYITEAHLGKPFNVDWQALLNRQLKAVVDVKESEAKDDPTKKYINAEIKGTNMWGPLDKEAEHIPHHPDAIQSAILAGQVNVVSKHKGPGPAVIGGVATHAATAPVGGAATQSTLPPAVDKYAGL